ncbi:MAG TPA: HAD family hydrolase [Thermoplasmata archaeon]|jgi:phosphoglycolate phosphatase-like HAD superfamily hydrolase|nr:HAD family hydrolase [Thermoplasmata archaeon]
MPPRDPTPHFLEPLLGVALDLDGTLVLSRHDFKRMRAEVVRLAERSGVVPGHLSVEQPIHKLIEQSREELRTAGVPDGTLFRFEAEVQRTIDRIELEALPRTVARPGAEPLLQMLAERGFRLGLLTRASETFARQALNRTDLARYFGYLRSRSAEGPAKPSPEALLHLLHEMGVPIDRAVYVGDHLLDAECAVAAHVRFYAVLPDPHETAGSSMTTERFLAAGASATAKDLFELARQLDVMAPATAP